MMVADGPIRRQREKLPVSTWGGGGEMGRGTNVLAHFPRYMGDEPADGAAVSILESERRPAQY